MKIERRKVTMNGLQVSKSEKPSNSGSWIKRALFAGIIAGATVRTAASGARVVLDGTTGLHQIDSSGNISFNADLGGIVWQRAIWGLSITGTHLTNHLDLINERFEFVKGNTIYVDPYNSIIGLGSGPAALLIKTAAGQSIDLRPADTPIMSIATDGARMFNVAAEPSAPASGGVFYAYGGALKYISAGGTRTVVAPN
jgi:hypothetical protein